MQLFGNKNFVFITSLILYVSYSLLVVMSCENIFFWDTVQLGAKHGLHFFDTNFGSTLLPDDIDSGHVPIFGVYLAAMWMVFGKNLAVSHLAMMPFVLMLLYQIIKLCKTIINSNQYPMLACLVCADPTLIAQCTLISPDVLLMASFVGAIRCVYIGEHSLSKYLFFVVLALISMRGMMLLVIIFVWDCYLLYCDKKRKSSIAFLFPYVLAGIPFILYMFWHYIEKGWIGYHSLSPWAPSFEKVGFDGFIKNIGIMIWRIVDFGRWPFLLGLSYVFIKKYFKRSFGSLDVLLLLVTFGLGYSFVTYSGLQGHRYLMPVYFLITIIVFLQISKLKNVYLFSTMIMLSLITGHFWIYPQNISQGWDASLAHRPYFDLWSHAMDYLEQHNIDINQIGSSFPNANRIRSLSLEDSNKSFLEKNIGITPYLLISSVMNDVDKEDYDKIAIHYLILKEWKNRGVYMTLWKLKR
jgi:hypothetical protein